MPQYSPANSIPAINMNQTQGQREEDRKLDYLYLHAFAAMNDFQEITSTLVQFRDARDWGQFHTAKDLAVALNIEAGELLECYLWKSAEEASREKVKEELADVMNYALLLADRYGFDVKEMLLDKIRKNGEKYPVDKAKGNAKKYDEL